MDDEREEQEEEEERRRGDGKLGRALIWVQLAAASADLVWSVVEAVRTIAS